MPWTETTRRQYRRDRLRYASDLTDEEWSRIEPHLPAAKPLGRPRATDLREVVNAMLCLLTGGCQWRMLPKEFPPYSTVQRFFYGWRDDGTWQRIHHELLMAAREAAGPATGPATGPGASPSAGIIDSQSVKTTEAGGPRGYDAGKKVPPRSADRVRFAGRIDRLLTVDGRKRHIVTDTGGLLVAASVHEAGIQDRDGAVPLLASIRDTFPWLRHVFADGGYAGAKLEGALATLGPWPLEIVKRPRAAAAFEVLPRRWVVERTFAWLGRNRRLAKDFESLLTTAVAWLMLASIKLLSRRLART